MTRTLPLRLLGMAAAITIAGQACSVTIYGLSTNNQLVRFDSATPGVLQSAYFINGLQASEQVLGLDYRPATGVLYALGSSNRVYTLNVGNGQAASVGTFATTLNGTNFGFDFNPVVDRIRVTSDLDQNLRLNPNNGALAAQDTNLAYAGTDVNAGANPNVVASAYTNNFNGATTTTLYNIDSQLDILVTQNPPNNGTLNTVGALGFNTSGLTGFDIAQGSGIAYASLTAPGGTSSGLFTINLTTGAASAIGTIGVGDGTLQLRDLAVQAVPEPTTIAAIGVGMIALLRRRKQLASS